MIRSLALLASLLTIAACGEDVALGGSDADIDAPATTVDAPDIDALAIDALDIDALAIDALDADAPVDALAIDGPDILTYKLTVVLEGTGTGFVASTPAGIACGTVCSAQFPAGTIIVLTASPAVGSTFTGWTTTCTGSATCAVGINGPVTVTAHFTLN